MNRRLLLGRLATGLASAVVAPMAFVGGTRKFVVPEKIDLWKVASSVPTVTTGASGLIYGLEQPANETQTIVLEPQHALAETLPEPATPFGAIKKDEIIYTFLGQPCVLKFWELRCTNSNVEMVETVLRGIQEATKRGITAQTPNPSGAVSQRMIDPWPNADLLLKRAEAVKTDEARRIAWQVQIRDSEMTRISDKLSRTYGCS